MARKIVIDVTEEMYVALREEKNTTGVPIASQVRLSLQKSLADKGKRVSIDVGAWGGDRPAKTERTA